MKKDNVTSINNDEIVTISRTEYEDLQQQVEKLKAQLAAVNSADNVVIPSSEYEELKQQVDWLIQQLVTMQKDEYATKSKAWNEVMEQLSLMANEPESYLTPKTVKEIQVPSHKRQRKLSVLNEEKLQRRKTVTGDEQMLVIQCSQEVGVVTEIDLDGEGAVFIVGNEFGIGPGSDVIVLAEPCILKLVARQ